MAPPSKKRKIVDESKVQQDAALDDTDVSKSQNAQHLDQKVDSEPSEDSQPAITLVDKTQERKERFKALQARAVSVLHSATSEWPSTDRYAAKVRSDQP